MKFVKIAERSIAACGRCAKAVLRRASYSTANSLFSILGKHMRRVEGLRILIGCSCESLTGYLTLDLHLSCLVCSCIFLFLVSKLREDLALFVRAMASILRLTMFKCRNIRGGLVNDPHCCDLLVFDEACFVCLFEAIKNVERFHHKIIRF